MTDTVLKWFLSLAILAGFFYLSFDIVTGQIKTNDANMLLLIGTVFGAASSYAGNVVNYHFGSSKTSSDKDKTISSMAASIPVQGSTQTVLSTQTVEPVPPKDKPPT